MAHHHPHDVMPRTSGPVDHIALARAGFAVELERCGEAIAELDRRMEDREVEIATLQRQQAEERRERAQAELSRRAAARAIAELDGAAS